MASPSPSKKSTNQFMRQGHTDAGAFGSKVNMTPKGQAGDAPKEIKP